MGKEMNARPMNAMNRRPVPNAGKSLQSRPAPQQTGYNSSAYASRQMPSQTPVQAPKPQVSQTAETINKTAQSEDFIRTQQQLSEANVTGAAQQLNINQQGDGLTSFVNSIKGMVSPFATFNEDILRKNMDLAMGKGMSNDDRTISFECIDYLMSNLGFIIMGLVLDKAFKDSFMEALLVEMSIDSKSEKEKEDIRRQMKDSKTYPSAGNITFGLTTFVPDIALDLMDKMEKSFKLLDTYADEFDEAIDKLSDEQKTEFGFIFSNFMYLIRAFTHNDIFMAYIVTVIEKVKAIIVK